MAKVVPTVLAADPKDYEARMNRARSLSTRVHVDISDGEFTQPATINAAQVHRIEGIELDFHLMVKHPDQILETVLSVHPHLIIFHAESEGDIKGLIQHASELGVKAGLAILPQTKPERIKDLVPYADHVLIFTGTLGHNGGEFQPDQLKKVDELRAMRPQLEISVDGGVSDRDAALIATKGVDVLYVGSFLQSADDPKAALESINRQIGVTV